MATTLQSVHEALRVLLLLQEVESATLTELAMQLGLGTSTVHRLLATMKEDRFVSQGPGKQYRLGPVMTGSPSEAAISHCVDVSGPYLRRLRDLTRETVHISTLHDDLVEFVAVCESQLMMRVASKVGEALPAHLTSAGKVLLAELDTDEVATRYPHQELDGSTERGIATREALFAELQRTRERGFGRNFDESEVGLTALAVPLQRPTGRVLCALTVTGPTARLNPQGETELSDRERSLLRAMAACAEAIQGELRI